MTNLPGYIHIYIYIVIYVSVKYYGIIIANIYNGLMNYNIVVFFMAIIMVITLWWTNIAIENDHLSWIYPLKIVIFHSYVSLPEGNFQDCPRAEDKILDNSAGIFQSSGSGGMGNQPAELPVPRRHVKLGNWGPLGNWGDIKIC